MNRTHSNLLKLITTLIFSITSLPFSTTPAQAYGLASLYLLPGSLACNADEEQCNDAQARVWFEAAGSYSLISVENYAVSDSHLIGQGNGGTARISMGGTLSRALGGLGMEVYGEVGQQAFWLAEAENSAPIADTPESLRLSRLGTGVNYCALANTPLSLCLEGGFFLGYGEVDTRGSIDSGYSVGAGMRLNVLDKARLHGRYRIITSSTLHNSWYGEEAVEVSVSMKVAQLKKPKK